MSTMNGATSPDNHGKGFAQVAPPNSTGIKIIVVGAGFAGLACAIESKRKGHEVVILEKFKELKALGDIISFGNNAGRVFERWGLHDKFWAVCSHVETLMIHNSQGELLLEQPNPDPLFGAYAYNGHRGELHTMLFDYAQSLGIDIRLGQDVTEYWETDNEAGVIANSEKIAADVVVGADGVRSRARTLVLGYEDKPKSSGYAVYRSWFDCAEQGVDKDPMTSFICQGKDLFYGWIGKDVHFLAHSSSGGKKLSNVITHKDDADIAESWSFPGKMEDCLKIVEGWDPRCAALLSKAPSLVDWKLVYRDPMPTWISKGARLALIGDAAHPFLPTSQQGASQAVEDGVTLAVVLQLAGKENVHLAVREWEKIRYQRVRRAQLIGESVRDMWHKAKPEDRGNAVALPRPEWLLGHDAEKHAYEVYDATTKEIQEKGYELPTLPPVVPVAGA
ncbi:FAD/NAD P-binding domain-containing protein [Gloeophyllum trabeum ATCC 11539]|uniref:FAD/NAD P-binding domain-containing protein n=1 Tax=Gloeophyllum trabeum (strain ATCC 11539 / FP-39264 / Madison 617) TaxID=670483 RepID=S7S5J4_GLOTA|nr:FAD/NAD P-binding domain-containing protein [Gloeophyllum trabeum ATCC 11539]EPQ61259.1 FAD/NAD P-binding domain-containing protein [Gloeophyllum trabeum ATCC 11539]